MSKSLLSACLLTAGVALLAVALAGEQPAPRKSDERIEKPVDPEATPEQRKKIAGLIKDLSAEVYTTRKAAGDALLKIGRPALIQLRAAAKSDDFETSESAHKLIADIEGDRGRSTIKITTKGSREKGDFEISLISSMETVTVSDFEASFAVSIKPAAGTLKLYTEPDKQAFQKKYPGIWKEYVEALLDEKLHENAIKDAMIRELMPQVLRQFDKVRKREPKPEEVKAMKKMIREKLDKLFKKKVTVAADPETAKPEKPTELAKPKSPRRENPAAGPQLVPLEP